MGGIVMDDTMATSAPNVGACGNCVETEDPPDRQARPLHAVEQRAPAGPRRGQQHGRGEPPVRRQRQHHHGGLREPVRHLGGISGHHPAYGTDELKCGGCGMEWRLSWTSRTNGKIRGPVWSKVKAEGV